MVHKPISITPSSVKAENVKFLATENRTLIQPESQIILEKKSITGSFAEALILEQISDVNRWFVGFDVLHPRSKTKFI